MCMRLTIVLKLNFAIYFQIVNLVILCISRLSRGVAYVMYLCSFPFSVIGRIVFKVKNWLIILLSFNNLAANLMKLNTEI